MSRTVSVVLILGVALLAMAVKLAFFTGFSREVQTLIDKNVEARGGEAAWARVQSLRLAGQMDLGQGLSVPYTIEQKRPEKMCLEYTFDKRRVAQCVDGKSGWQFLPFLGKNVPEPMSEADAARMADTASIDGLLLNAYERDFEIELVGTEVVDGKTTHKLWVRMPGGTQRWIYLDDATGLESKLEFTRVVRGEERMVETIISQWGSHEGVLIPVRQNTREVDAAESHFVTVEEVVINPDIADDRFDMPEFARSRA